MKKRWYLWHLSVRKTREKTTNKSRKDKQKSKQWSTFEFMNQGINFKVVVLISFQWTYAGLMAASCSHNIGWWELLLLFGFDIAAVLFFCVCVPFCVLVVVCCGLWGRWWGFVLCFFFLCSNQKKKETNRSVTKKGCQKDQKKGKQSIQDTQRRKMGDSVVGRRDKIVFCFLLFLLR